MSPPADELSAILARQRAAFFRDGPPSLEARRADLRKLRALLVAKRAAIEAAVNEDYGHRSRHETAAMELMTLTMGIDYLIRRLPRFMRRERRSVAWPLRFGRAWVDWQPLGVVGIISPWNYPVSLALMPFATALAAGNRAMIKPSEVTSVTGALLKAMLSEAFGADQVAVALGGVDVGKAFASLPFDHLIFTGSPLVGRAVMRAAAEALTPVTLELGGKSPAILGARADIAGAAAAIAYGKLANSGQTCIAPDYALLPEASLDAFAAAYSKAVASLYPDGPTSADYTAIVDDRQFARLNALIEDARAKGARIVPVGAKPESARDRARTIAPTLVLGANESMAIMREEIFGPVLPVLTYRGIDEAIAFVNARPRPLALYLFGPDDGERREVLARTTSGNVTINGTLLHYAQDDLPFGGIGASGIGAYHGGEGFRALSHAKGVFVRGRWNASGLLRAPYGWIGDRVLGFFLR